MQLKITVYLISKKLKIWFIIPLLVDCWVFTEFLEKQVYVSEVRKTKQVYN